MFGHFPVCFGAAVATPTDREGRRSPTVLSADALCMRSSSAAALLPLRVLRTEARVTASAQLRSPGSTSGCMCDLTDRPVFITPRRVHMVAGRSSSASQWRTEQRHADDTPDGACDTTSTGDAAQHDQTHTRIALCGHFSFHQELLGFQ